MKPVPLPGGCPANLSTCRSSRAAGWVDWLGGLLLACACLLVSTLPARAATMSWTNTGGGLWNVAANWSPNQVPGPGDSATLGLNVNVTNTVPVTVSNFTFTTGNLKGSAPVTVTETLTWTSGNLGGALTIGATGNFNISNALNFISTGGGTLTNLGTVIWSSGNISAYGGAVIHNAGLWQVQGNNVLSTFSGTNFFFNSGTLLKSGGSGASVINWRFNTTGTVNTLVGSFTVGQWTGTSILNGTNRLSLGTLNAALTVASNAMMSWVGGDVTGGTLTIAPGGTLNISNTVSFGAGSGVGVLTNLGTVNWSDGLIYGYGGAVIQNAGLWLATGNDTVSSQSGTNFFFNSGSFQKTGGAGASTITWRFNTTGIVDTPVGSLTLGQWNGNSILNGAPMLSFSTLNASLTVASNATLNWIGGDITGGALTVAPGGTLNISNTVTFGAGSGAGALTNHGTVNWGGTANINGYGGGLIHNTGLWQAFANNTLSSQSGTNTFINTGTFRKAAGTGNTTITWEFLTTGTVETLTGFLALNNWTGGNTLSGDLRLSGGTLHGTLDVAAGTVVNMAGVNIRGNLTVASNALMNWASGVDVSSGAAVSVAPGGTLVISNNITMGVAGGGGSLTNHGTVVWAGGTISGYGGITVHNAALWQALADNTFSVASGVNSFVNSGTFQKTGGAGSTTINWRFNTTGIIDTTTGTLSLNQWTGESTFHGTARLSLGTMSTSLTVASNAVMSWAGGDVSGGALTVAPGGTLSLSNNVTMGVSSPAGALTNYGTVVWSAGTLTGYGSSTIHNAGLWQATGNNTVGTGSGVNTFTNTGTFEKTGGAGSTSISWSFSNAGVVRMFTGTLVMNSAYLQAQGLTLLDGGALSLGQPFHLQGGVLAGTNTISGSVTNSSVISPGGDLAGGKLTITGSYLQTALGTLNVELGGTNAGVDFDRLQVNGATTLGGTLNVILLDPFVPAVSNVFRVATWSSFTGDFAAVNGLSLLTNLYLTETLLTTALDLTAVATNNTTFTPPQIVTQPQSQTIINGQTASFLATATGTRPLTYQWQFQSTNLPGATNASLVLTNTQTNQAGNYRLVVTNGGGAVTSAVAVLTVRPVTDLIITDIVNPTNAVAGQPLLLSWRSVNQGVQTALAPWTESVSLSTNASGVPASVIGNFVITSNLLAGQFVTRTQAVNIPGGLNGNYYVVVTTDAGNAVVEELNETNNVTVSPVPMFIGSPDLQPVLLSVPGSGQFGNAIAISWTITNRSTVPVPVTWLDRVYLGTNSNSLAGATLLATVAMTNTPVPAGGKTTNAASVTPPLSALSSPGTHYLLVAVDDANAIAETNEVNNLIAGAISLDFPPLPDLLVTNLDLNDGIPLASGRDLTVRWAITNAGLAAASLLPGDLLTIRNTNTGVVLFSGAIDSGNTNSLAAGAIRFRTNTITLPEGTNGAGTIEVVVTTDPLNAVFERNGTNTAELNNSITNFIVSTLSVYPDLRVTNLVVTPDPAASGANLLIQWNDVNRGSGPASNAWYDRVRIVNSNTTLLDTTLSFDTGVLGPLATNAPQARSLNFTLPQGAAGAGSLVVTVTVDAFDQVSEIAAGFDAETNNAVTLVLSSTLPLPRLLTFTLATNALVEGATTMATVTRSVVEGTPLEVSLLASDSLQIGVPATVTIAAGQGTTNFSVSAIQDTLVERTNLYSVTAAAAGYVSAVTNLSVVDDDIPNLIITLADHTISENAGPNATTGTVTRDRNSARELKVLLFSSDSTNATVPVSVTIPAAQTNANFSVAAINNAVVNPPRSVTISGFVADSVTGQPLRGATSGVLTINDDESPSLTVTIARKLVGEGLNPATIATVTRNGDTSGALLVNLLSSSTNEITVLASVTIPAGSNSVAFNLVSVNDGIVDGNQSVLIAASAVGYLSGADALVVSDANLPDLIIAEITPPLTNVLAGELFTATYKVFNQGNAATGTNFTQQVTISDDERIGGDTLAGAFAFSGTLASGQFFSLSLPVRAPLMVGDYWLAVRADASNVISETLEDNNATLASAPFYVVAPYTVTIAPDTNVAPANTPMTLRGVATKAGGGPAAYMPVAIYLRVRGTERLLGAITDATGHYVTTFQPLPGEAGVYELAAAYPGVSSALTQATFTLFGMSVATPGTVTVIEGATVTNALEVLNLSDVPLTGLTATVLSNSGGLTFSANVASNTLAGDGTNQLLYSVTAPLGTLGGSARVRLTATEGVTNDVDFVFQVATLTPRLVASPGKLEAGMKRGAQRPIYFAVTNSGGAATGPMQVLLPSVPWLSVSSGAELPSLAPGEGAVISLLLMPASDLPLGPYTGAIVIGNGAASVSVPFTFQNLSDAAGDLRITAQDEYTFYAAGAPKVTNATVNILDAFTGALVLTTNTGSAGVVLLTNLAEAYYNVEVEADGHGSFRAAVLVFAGTTNDVSAFLPRETVKYFWTVEPTTIEDRNKITVETVFETFVPIPVVTIEPALIELADMTNEVMQIDLKISNHGLIAAENAEIYFGATPGFEFKPLINQIGSLPAMSTLTVPLTIRRLNTTNSSFAGKGVANAGGGEEPPFCKGLGGILWNLLCGGNTHTYNSPVGIQNSTVQCSTPAIGFFGGLGGGGGYVTTLPPRWSCLDCGGWPIYGSTRSGPHTGYIPPRCELCPPPPPPVVTPPSVMVRKNPCDDCQLKLALMLLNDSPFGQRFNGVLDSLAGATEKIQNLYNTYQDMSQNGVNSDNAGDLANQLIPSDYLDDLNPAKDLQEQFDEVKDLLDKAKDYLDVVASCEWAQQLRQRLGFGGSSSLAGLLGQYTAAKGIPPAALGSEFSAGDITPLANQLGRAQALLLARTNVFGSDVWFANANDDELTAVVNWLGQFRARYATNSDGGVLISAIERDELMALPRPAAVSTNEAHRFLDRWNRTRTYYASGIFNLSQVPLNQSTDFIALDVQGQLLQTAQQGIVASQQEGYADLGEAAHAAKNDLLDRLGNSGGGTCAKIRLRLEQEAVITRDAFKATLEIENNTADSLTEVSVELSISDTAGNSSLPLFFVGSPTLRNLSAVDGSGVIGTNSTAKATWLLIPSSDAAPTNQTRHFVSGRLSYLQNGLLVSVPLAPTSIDVLPNPKLVMQYFHQRDVIADDPFTDEIELSLPYSLGVLVKNEGFGTARNLRINSAQPEIVENERGLLIDFRTIGTEVNGQNFTPSLNADFGDIEPGGVSVGRWLFLSTLHGLFTDYKADFQHDDDLGGTRLSLIDRVEIHEMIRVVRADRTFEDGKPDFLVNDVSDVGDRPDTIYFSQGSNATVSVVTNANVDAPASAGHLTVALTVSLPAGWSYLRVPDPGSNGFTLKEVRRADNSLIGVGTNAWTTDRTFVGLSRRPVRENILHLLDYNSAGSYSLVYEPIPPADTNAPASMVTALPASSLTQFIVNWAGADTTNGSGVAAFDVYVSTNAGPFLPWLTQTPLTGALFTGVLGSSYAFYSVATDHAGNHEPAPLTPDTQTSVTLTNSPPVLAAISNQTVETRAELNLPVSASDPNAPPQVLSFTLASGAPGGMTIDAATGVLRWPVGAAFGGTTNPVTVIVQDNGMPPLMDSKSFNVIVNRGNTPPVLTAISNATVNEGELLTLGFTATDGDLPAQTLAYSLAGGAPSGTFLVASNGAFTWQPTESQGGPNYPITVIVTDNGVPPLMDSKSFLVKVEKVNSAPVLASVSNQLVQVLTTLSLTNSASDSDLPGDAVTYALTAGGGIGATLNTNTGVLTWMPTKAQAGTTNLVTVTATDNGVPALSDAKSFSVVVGHYLELSLGSGGVGAGLTSSVPVTLFSSVALTNLDVTMTFANLGDVPLTNLVLQPFNASLATGRVDRLNEHQARLNLDAIGGPLPTGPVSIGQLNFTALTNAIAQVIPLVPGSVSGVRNGGELVSRSFATNGQLVVIGNQPRLEPFLSSGQRSLTFYGLPGSNYTLQYATNLGNPTVWLPWQITATNFINLLEILPTNTPAIFFRPAP